MVERVVRWLMGCIPCGEACFKILGSALRGSIWICRKLEAWVCICFCRRSWVGEVVGRSRMRVAAMEY